MLAMQGLRAFSLSPNRDSTRISCGAHGAFVGDVALLRRMQRTGETGVWTARSVVELNSELTTRYRLPIDVSSKAGALALIANAFNRSDLATAAIATVQMQFPDLPSLAKGPESTNEMIPRALELHRSHLLKVDLDWEAKHPRTGTPPNPGWFALVPTRPQAPNVVPAAMPHPLRPWDHRDLFGGEGGEGVGGGGGEGVPRGSPRPLSPSESPPKPPTLYINNPKICDNCTRLLPKMLPPGSTLNVVLPDGTVMQFKGISP
jgi:hypothetical protein